MAQTNNPKMAGHAAQLQQHLDNQSGLAATASDQAPRKHPLEPKVGAWAKGHAASSVPPGPNDASGPKNCGPATKAGSATGVPGAGQISQ